MNTNLKFVKIYISIKEDVVDKKTAYFSMLTHKDKTKFLYDVKKYIDPIKVLSIALEEAISVLKEKCIVCICVKCVKRVYSNLKFSFSKNLKNKFLKNHVLDKFIISEDILYTPDFFELEKLSNFASDILYKREVENKIKHTTNNQSPKIFDNYIEKPKGLETKRTDGPKTQTYFSDEKKTFSCICNKCVWGVNGGCPQYKKISMNKCDDFQQVLSRYEVPKHWPKEMSSSYNNDKRKRRRW